MAIKLQIPVRNTLTVDKANKLLEIIQRKVAEGKVKEPDSLLAQLSKAFTDLFSKLKEPISQETSLHDNAVRDVEPYIELIVDSAHDIDVLLASVKELTAAAIESFNLSAVKQSILKVEIEKTRSASADVQLVDNTLGNSIMVAGDDFTSAAKTDPGFGISGDRADTFPGGFGVGLHRAGAANAVNPEIATVEIDVPEGSYEGRYYAPLGDAEPEGGEFHWEEQGPGADTPPASDGTRSGSRWRRRAEEILAKTSSSTLREKNFIDVGASEEDQMTARRKMLDSNPDTYWQVERTFSPQSLKALQRQQEALLDTEEGPNLTREDLEEKVKAADLMDFEVTLTVDLKEVKNTSWISLNPLNFQEGTWLEVVVVATAGEDEVFTPLPDFTELYTNERVITPEANEDLSEFESSTVLTEGKSFAGQGLWAFPLREVRYIRVTLKQDFPIPSIYSVYQALLEQTIETETTTKRRHKNHAGVVKEKTKNNITTVEVARPIVLTYEQSSMLFANECSSESLVSVGEREVVDPGEYTGPRSNRVKVSTKTTYSDSTLSEPMVETPMYDRLRYAIGIRDLEISTFTLAQTSTHISVVYEFPKPIYKFALEAVENIPEELRNVNQDDPWIQYYVSFNDSDWHAIAPASNSVLYTSDGKAVPQIINVNSMLPDGERNPVEGYVDSKGEVYQVRLKVVLNRPDSEEFETVSPILRSYRVKAYLKGDMI